MSSITVDVLLSSYQSNRRAVAAAEAKATPSVVPASMRSLRTRIGFWQERQRTRRQLARLPAWQLRDIGLTREQVLAETRKRFWED